MVFRVWIFDFDFFTIYLWFCWYPHLIYRQKTRLVAALVAGKHSVYMNDNIYVFKWCNIFHHLFSTMIFSDAQYLRISLSICNFLPLKFILLLKLLIGLPIDVQLFKIGKKKNFFFLELFLNYKMFVQFLCNWNNLKTKQNWNA